MQDSNACLPEVPQGMEFLVPFIAQCIHNEHPGLMNFDIDQAARSIVITLAKHGLEILDRSEIKTLVAKLEQAQEARGESSVTSDVDEALNSAKEYLEGLLPN